MQLGQSSEPGVLSLREEPPAGGCEAFPGVWGSQVTQSQPLSSHRAQRQLEARGWTAALSCPGPDRFL